MRQAPRLITFDIFGTVLDWRSGLEEACRLAGRPLVAGEFDRIVDAQGRLEEGGFLDYATVTRRSLVDTLGLSETKAAEIGAGIGRWPLYADAPALRDIMAIVPCVAMTNSDRSHGEDVQAQLGFRLSDWVCAEDVRVYKPNPEFWRQTSRRCGIEPGAHWWHVSAYCDYDLEVANKLGLTTVFLARPHARAGLATYAARGLSDVLRVVL